MILIVDLGYRENSLGLDEFVMPIVHIVREAGADCCIRHFTDIDEDILRQADGVILCGTALRDNLFADRIGEFAWLEGFEKPVLGICAGMQVLTLIFGGSIEACGEIGMTDIRVTAADPLFDGRDDFTAYELHTFSVKPPEPFTVLAHSDRCIQAVRHRARPLYGVIFHPEVRSEWVVTRFLHQNGLVA
ncbi:hypothetical protein FGU65_05445 [Methanoculleus sp. FWC-SCC1]|uniref:Glutamine amidotransferase domain-containing protein n=1 Tax=Methanoculleus frigidifontis TaxID=2584085 RepID=A0ABT8M8R7_9EURY|nr:hypothetical protein [Methanoculleus sp. FWC-SCC1]MDN7024339.1 hypothetical protein [Methanoculleus sp. FWC-SCC1]